MPVDRRLALEHLEDLVRLVVREEVVVEQVDLVERDGRGRHLFASPVVPAGRPPATVGILYPEHGASVYPGAEQERDGCS